MYALHRGHHGCCGFGSRHQHARCLHRRGIQTNGAGGIEPDGTSGGRVQCRRHEPRRGSCPSRGRLSRGCHNLDDNLDDRNVYLELAHAFVDQGHVPCPFLKLHGGIAGHLGQLHCLRWRHGLSDHRQDLGNECRVLGELHNNEKDLDLLTELHFLGIRLVDHHGRQRLRIHATIDHDVDNLDGNIHGHVRWHGRHDRRCHCHGRSCRGISCSIGNKGEQGGQGQLEDPHLVRLCRRR